jgi:hypothetical protein
MPHVSDEEYAGLLSALAERDAALERARILVGILTVGQVIRAGDRAISAAGLNPWCLNEGRAAAEDLLGSRCLECGDHGFKPAVRPNRGGDRSR